MKLETTLPKSVTDWHVDTRGGRKRPSTNKTQRAENARIQIGVSTDRSGHNINDKRRRGYEKRQFDLPSTDVRREQIDDRSPRLAARSRVGERDGVHRRECSTPDATPRGAKAPLHKH
ncbi:unnamed protein product [Macrosiphum euphorbiae]|uniref:Uncharacterized protein n=1 Tax=Macrosiphum euphorbiae TaxID=13131 RepID=A0AAV0XRW4_9HEMI|nr:unnamed protein product [Macrosiphum euphorbiae]